MLKIWIEAASKMVPWDVIGMAAIISTVILTTLALATLF